MDLPDDLIREIYGILTFPMKEKSQLLCKLTNNLYKDEIKKIKKIQSFYRQHKIDEDYLLNAGKEKYKSFSTNIDHNDWDSKLLYRFYLAKYPEEQLYGFPDFLVKKMYNNHDSERKIQLISWLQENPAPVEERNRRFISRFFRENQITSREILITGW
jgi:hypothetical protein